jgi:Fe-S-cluster containining protein
MESYLRPGLSFGDASRICMGQCQAQCCRGPLVLELSKEEVKVMEGLAAALGITAEISQAPGGGGWIRFADHVGEHCPFLDSVTSACRIYANRPRRCRRFPEGPTPGCAISGGG